MFKLSNLLENNHYQKLTFNQEDVMISGVYATDLLSTAIKYMKSSVALITVITSQSTLNLALMLDLKLIIFTKDADVSESFIQKANEEGISLVHTDYLTHEVLIDLVKRGLL